MAEGADVVVLPELVTSGYYFESEGEVREAAVPRDHPVFDRWAAHGAVVIAGFAELAPDGRLFSSAVVLDGPRGRDFYRKAHLWDTEQVWFTPGDEPPLVIDTDLGRIGVMVCYDLEFPEFVRSVALRGADLLAVPTNWPLVDRPPGLPAPEVVIAMAAARVNHLPIACCDRSGAERGHAWNEATAIVGADGWVVATADDTGVARADVDLGAGRDKRVSARNDLLADRRPELYAT